MFYLGYCYYKGLKVEKDFKKAVFFYSKASENGNADAQNNLGYCYQHGEGV
jgi:TPR repeat protein